MQNKKKAQPIIRQRAVSFFNKTNFRLMAVLINIIFLKKTDFIKLISQTKLKKSLK